MRHVISQGELREILLAHAEKPSALAYRELPSECDREFWLSLDDTHRAWYGAVPESMVMGEPTAAQRATGTRSGKHMRFVLEPGSYNAWVVDE